MSLRGNMKDIGITGLLQFIAQEEKTGMIEIKHEGQVHKIFFDKGNMVGTVPRPAMLGEMMIRHGYIDEEDLDRALRIHEETLQLLGQVLIKMGKITHGELKHLLNLQVLEGLRKILPLKQGEFEFSPVEVEFDRDWIEPVPVAALLIDGLKMVDEWPAIRKAVGPSTGIPMRIEVSCDGTENGDEDSLRILGLVDGEKNIEKIVDLGRIGEFETYRILNGFIKEGLIEIKDEGQAPDIKARQRRGRVVSGVLRWSIIIVLAAALILVIGLLSARGIPVAFEWLRGGMLSSSDTVAVMKIEEIRRGLDIYHMESGEYPLKLSVLEKKGLIRNPSIIDPAKSQISYVKTEKAYHLILGREPLVRAGSDWAVPAADGEVAD